MITGLEFLPNVENTPDRPQYLILRDQIAKAIEVGKLSAGSRLPSERQLQNETRTARGTIREALFQLEAEGLIYRRDRSGWYISPPPVIYDPTRWAGFMTYVTEQLRIPKTQTLARESIAAPAAVSDIFRLAPGTTMFAITRRRSIDGRGVLIERIFLNPAMVPGLLEHSLDGSLTQILTSHYGLSVAHHHIEMRPCALTAFAAKELGVKPGTPGLLVVRTSFTADGSVVEYDHEYWRHDSICIHVDLNVREDRESGWPRPNEPVEQS